MERLPRKFSFVARSDYISTIGSLHTPYDVLSILKSSPRQVNILTGDNPRLIQAVLPRETLLVTLCKA